MERKQGPDHVFTHSFSLLFDLSLERTVEADMGGVPVEDFLDKDTPDALLPKQQGEDFLELYLLSICKIQKKLI